MGLAERFKTELENQDIYSITKKINKNKVVTPPEELSSDDFSLIVSGLINKIQNTPYWSDYSKKSQENMITKYFEAKNKRSNIKYKTDDKLNFVKTVLNMSSH